MQTALVLRVPEAEAAIAAFRLAYDPSAGEGMPAHITVLFPFRPSEGIDSACLEALGRLFAATAPFKLVFRAFGRFTDTLWLQPNPAAPVRWLTEMLIEAFPDCPPYDGVFADIVPHLTVAQAEESTLGRVQAALAPALVPPIEAFIDACSLFARHPEGWREVQRFRLGAAPSPSTPP